MRLTLRTLLAYLDGSLGPDQASEIGNKLAESKVASYLVNRIHDVLHQPQLAAPTDGSLDANTMAEYLDNALTPDEVLVVEKRCLESDMQLAEAAASHQILTLFLRESVDIAADTRQRMHDLILEGSRDGEPAITAPIQPARSHKADDPRDDTPRAQQLQTVNAVVVPSDVPPAEQPKKVTAVVRMESTQPAQQTKTRTAAIHYKRHEKSRARPLWQRTLPVSLSALAIGLLALVGWLSGFWGKETAPPNKTVARTDAPKIGATKKAGRPAPGASNGKAPGPATSPPSKAKGAPAKVAPSATPVSAAPTIAAKPNPVPANSKATTIIYDVGQAKIGEVYVSTNGGAEKLVVLGKKGVKDVNWIDKGTYEFRLYEGREHKNRLATVTVSRETK